MAYLAATSNFGSRRANVVGGVGSGDDDGDDDERLSGGVEVVSRHCHSCSATTSTHSTSSRRQGLNVNRREKLRGDGG